MQQNEPLGKSMQENSKKTIQVSRQKFHIRHVDLGECHFDKTSQCP